MLKSSFTGRLIEAGCDEAGRGCLAGPVFSRLAGKYGFKSFADTTALRLFLTKQNINGFTILVKGSRGIGLEKIYDLL